MFSALFSTNRTKKSKNAVGKSPKTRSQRLVGEMLERREMLSVTPVPTIPTIQAKDTQVTAQTVAVVWNAAQHATSYNVELVQSNKVVQQNGNLSAAVNTTEFSNLSPDTTYSVVVEAVDSAGSAKSSTSVTTESAPWQTTPGAPVAHAAAEGATEILVSWKAVNGATNYIVEQQQANGSYVQITEVGKDTTGFTVENLNPKTQYSFQVIAVDSAGHETPASSPVSATTSAKPTTTSTPASASTTGTASNSNDSLDSLTELLLVLDLITNSPSAKAPTVTSAAPTQPTQTYLVYPNLQEMNGALGQIGESANYESLSGDGYGPYDSLNGGSESDSEDDGSSD